MVASPSLQPGPRRRARTSDDFDASCDRCGAGLSPRLLETADDHLICLFCGSTVAPERPDAERPARTARPVAPGNVTLLGPRGDLDRRSRIRPRPLVLMLLSLVAIALVAVLGRGGTQTPLEEVAAGEPPTRPVPLVEPEEPVRVAPEPVVAAPIDRIELSIVAVEPCWVRLETDGRERVARTLEPGERISFRAQENAFVRLGNAGGVRVRANDRVVRTGEPGHVVDLRLALHDGSVRVSRSP